MSAYEVWYPDKADTPQLEEPSPQPPQAPWTRPRGILLRPLVFLFLHLFLQALIWSLVVSIVIFPQLQGLADPQSEIKRLMLSAARDPQVLLYAPLAIAVITSLVYALYLRARRRQVADIIHLAALRPGIPAFAAIVTFGSQGIAFVWLFVLDQIRHLIPFVEVQMSSYEELVNQIVGGGESLPTAWELLILFIDVVLFTPLAEELLFRGIVMGELRRGYTASVSLFLQAVFFGLMHGNFVQSVYAFALALAIGYLYLSSDNLFVCIAMHGVFNFFGAFLPVFLPFLLVRLAGLSEAAARQSAEGIAQLLHGLELVLFCLMLLMIFRRERER